jgi:cytochrome c oxidase subunit 2
MPQFDDRLGQSSGDSVSRRQIRRKPLALVLVLSIVAALVLSACAGVSDSGTQLDELQTREARNNAPPPTTGSPEVPGGADTDPGNLAAVGQQLYMTQGCVGCHSLDGSTSVGPTWQGIIGRETPLDSGETVTADEAYIAESIREPGAKVHEGFGNIMPSYAQLTDEDIQAFIAFMETLQ